MDMFCSDLGMNLKKPIDVRIDNVAAIYMGERSGSVGRTKHVDVKYHHVREHIEQGFVRLKFVESAKNLADMFTKNVKREVLDAHQGKFVEAETEFG